MSQSLVALAHHRVTVGTQAFHRLGQAGFHLRGRVVVDLHAHGRFGDPHEVRDDAVPQQLGILTGFMFDDVAVQCVLRTGVWAAVPTRYPFGTRAALPASHAPMVGERRPSRPSRRSGATARRYCGGESSRGWPSMDDGSFSLPWQSPH